MRAFSAGPPVWRRTGAPFFAFPLPFHPHPYFFPWVLSLVPFFLFLFFKKAEECLELVRLAGHDQQSLAACLHEQLTADVKACRDHPALCLDVGTIDALDRFLARPPVDLLTSNATRAVQGLSWVLLTHAWQAREDYTVFPIFVGEKKEKKRGGGGG
jgi:hypothetical protein